MSANMDTTGTFEIAQVMATHKCITCLHKHYEPNQIVEWAQTNPEAANYSAVSMGTSDADLAKVSAVLEQTLFRLKPSLIYPQRNLERSVTGST